ncbi:hypothetical protein M408DRAFT_307752 [Serendipita vermifera MAFF 305830]|uniref:PNPLA domain-containing protein n=1 Tax=Serendipita vermifera MAFF 305830 TaxID=933852 RepID=A0A0C3AK90_SERVB|nr:hypothetical protein M408DRAFT_307752 [Serendipita vermifera MAFF 305830]
MNATSETKKAIRILAFDDGGPGAYSQLLLLNHYMNQVSIDVNKDPNNTHPADYFDIIGGVGFGGLIALMLGHLRMSVEDSIEALVSVATSVFPVAHQGTINSQLSVYEIPYSCGLSLIRLLHVTTDANLSYASAFRTYAFPGPRDPNPTIVDAICATMAVLPFFSPIHIGKAPTGRTFISGAMIMSNPTHGLLKEARHVFREDIHMFQILNIGSGLRGVHSLDGPESVLDVRRPPELENQDIARYIPAQVDKYIRLDVNRGMERIGISQWNKLGAIHSHTDAYWDAPEVKIKVDEFRKRLSETSGSSILEKIST